MDHRKPTTAEKLAYLQGQTDTREDIATRIEAERTALCGDRITGSAPLIRVALNSAAAIARVVAP